MKLHFGYLLGLGALAIAGTAAFFSVYGISQLFAGATMAVIIMASALEFGKLIGASYLQRYWIDIPKAIRGYVVVGVITLVVITSAGIYGFLSNAYQITANKYDIHTSEQAILDSKKKSFKTKILSNEDIIKNKNLRAEQLGNLRSSQEVRLDSLLANNHWFNAKKTREDINRATTEIQKLSIDVDEIVEKNGVLRDSVGKYDVLIVQKESTSEASAELGPLMYLSELTGWTMDRVVNYFILLLIFVFDPLAIALVLATNWVFMEEAKKNKKEMKKPEIDPYLDSQPDEAELFPKEKDEPSSIKPEVVNDAVNDAVNEAVKEPEIIEEVITEEVLKEILEEKPVVNDAVNEPIQRPEIVNSERPIAKNGIVKPVNNVGLTKQKDNISTSNITKTNVVKKDDRKFSKKIPRRNA